MRRQLGKLFWLWCIVSSAMWFISCSTDDDKAFPSLITDFVVVETNASRVLSNVRLDNGDLYDVASQGVSAGVADTTFRCVASYTLDDSGMMLYEATHIFSVLPVPLDEFLKDGEMEAEDLPRDPVSVISMWKSGGYVNMKLGVQTTGNGSHAYAFCEEREGVYSLLHLRPVNDDESYTETVYLSMPIPEGVESLTFSVNTYDGIYMRTF